MTMGVVVHGDDGCVTTVKRNNDGWSSEDVVLYVVRRQKWRRD
jgi:hypothetical protein